MPHHHGERQEDKDVRIRKDVDEPVNIVSDPDAESSRDALQACASLGRTYRALLDVRVLRIVVMAVSERTVMILRLVHDLQPKSNPC